MQHTESSHLVLLRHGESEWNARNLFTGWVNAPLTEAGEQAATRAGRLLAQEGLWPDVVHTSVLRRTIRTADLALAACDRDWVPARRSWRLNANHYGALQGRDKAEVAAEAGTVQVMLWRRSCAAAPPMAPVSHPYSQFDDPRYAGLPPEARPRGESLDEVTARLLPYWYDEIVPGLRAGQCVLVVSHGNTLRALVRHLDRLADREVAELEIPTATPLVYRVDADLRPSRRGGRYLGPVIAAPR
jgi:2,3-bisphosphoglycerate-dependent phosphoglycerate mutase